MIELSVVVPVHNERDNIVPLIEEIGAALKGVASFEIVYGHAWKTAPRAVSDAKTIRFQRHIS